MRKITNQILKGHITHVLLILMSFFFSFPFKTTIFMFVFLTFIRNFDFTSNFYILVLYSIFGKHKLGSSIFDQIGICAFTANL